MSLRHLLLCCATVLLSLPACGSDQSVDPGTTPPAADAGAMIEVNYLADSVDIDLSTLATVDFKASKLVKLTDVWTASKIAADPASLEFEFVGEDGFKPSTKTGCFDLPGTVLEKGYIDPNSRKLIWDETLGLAGCYSVNGAAKMNAHAPTDAGGPALDGSSE